MAKYICVDPQYKQDVGKGKICSRMRMRIPAYPMTLEY